MPRRVRLLLLAGLATASAACASTPDASLPEPPAAAEPAAPRHTDATPAPVGTPPDAGEAEAEPAPLALEELLEAEPDTPGEDVAEDGDALVWDPWEPLNRRTFAVNETLDGWVLEPVAIGWDFVLPNRVQISVSNFFTHLVLPVRFANDVFQLKPVKAFEDGGRFVVNTLVGFGGLFDPATAGGIPKHDEDFGQTLGHWGVPPGPYLVLPVLGPSNPRDTVGLVVDSSMAVQSFFLSFPILAAAAAVNAVNDRSLALDTVRAERESALDFYAAVRSAYTQFRANRVRDRAPAEDDAEAEEDLYYFDDEEEL